MSLDRVLRVAAYPALVLGALAGTMALAPIDRDLAYLVPQVVLWTMVLVLERIIPFERGWVRGPHDVLVDVLHAVFSATLVGTLVHVACEQLAARWAPSLGSPWPSRWPFAVQVVLALALGELGNYWLHRIEHTSWLWRLHALHHATPRVDALGQLRNHPIDVALTVVLATLPASLLGAPEDVRLAVVALASAHGPLQHANLDLRLGPLRHVFNVAEVHRHHHARAIAEANGNYAPMLLLWDHVFGTYLRFDSPTTREVGLPAGSPEEAMPERYLAHLAWPFRRTRRS